MRQPKEDAGAQLQTSHCIALHVLMEEDLQGTTQVAEKGTELVLAVLNAWAW
jgi:hypothetical protein